MTSMKDRMAMVALFHSAAVEGKAPQEILADLFSTFLVDQKGKYFDRAAFLQNAQTVFGPDFNELSARAFEPILASKGYLEVVERTPDGVIYRVLDAKSDVPDDVAPELFASFKTITEAFWEFFADKAGMLSLELEEKDAWENDLLAWLTSEDLDSHRQLKDSVRRLMEGQHVTGRIDDAIDEEPIYSGIDRYRLFRFAQFVNYSRRNDADTLKRITDFIEAGFVFRAVRGFSSAPEISDGDTDLTIIMDGPVVLDTVGLSGPERAKAVANVRELGAKAKIKFITLTHCVEEATDIVEAVLGNDKGMRWGLTGDSLKRDPELEAQAKRFRARPDEILRKHGIQVLPFDPTATPSEHGYFSQDLIDEFTAHANFGGPAPVLRRQRDAFSFAFIARRRGAHYRSDLFKSKFVLLTRNSIFVQFGERFVREHMPRVPNYASTYVIESSLLAALFWLRVSSSAARATPTLQFFSTCQRLLASNKTILTRARRKAMEALEGDELDQFELALGDPLAVEELVVRNAQASIATANADELLDAMRASVSERERNEARKVQRQIKRAHSKEKAQLTDQIAKSEAEREAARAEYTKLDEDRQAMLQGYTSQIQSAVPYWSRVFDIANAALFLGLGVLAIVNLFGVFTIRGLTVWVIVLAVLMAVSLLMRAALVGPSLRKRFAVHMAERRKARILSGLPETALKSEVRSLPVKSELDS